MAELNAAEIRATVARLEELLAKASGLPWTACGGSRPKPCQCSIVWSKPDDHPVLTVERGKWGDTYPAIRVEEGIGGKAEAFTEMIEYGAIPEEIADANVAFASEGISAIPALLAAIKALLADRERDAG